MRISIRLLLAAVLSLPVAASSTTVFRDVHVIPMTGEIPTSRQSVVVEGDRIAAVGPAGSVRVPDGATVIDGKGGWLMPGLADMHTHLHFDPDPAHLALYLAEGVTAIRSAGDTPEAVEWREQVRAGELLGPTIYTAGRTLTANADGFLGFGPYIFVFRAAVLLLPLALGWLASRYLQPLRAKRVWLLPVLLGLGAVGFFTHTPNFNLTRPFLYPEYPHAYYAGDPSTAIDELRRQKDLDVDLVKLYDGLSEETFVAAADEARRLGMYVIGHMPDHLDLGLVLSQLDEVAHVDEFNSFLWTRPNAEVYADFRQGIDPEIDETKIPGMVELMLRNDVTLVSNMSADWAILQMIRDTPAMLADPAYRVVRPSVIRAWKTEGRPVTVYARQGPYRQKELVIFGKLIKALHGAGGVITIGTDSAPSVEGTLPRQIHRELELLVEAGLTPEDALRAGTAVAGQVVTRMGGDGSFGTIAAGQRADLVLLRENPLEDVSHTRDRIGVMTRGRWYTQQALDQRVDAFVQAFRAD